MGSAEGSEGAKERSETTYLLKGMSLEPAETAVPSDEVPQFLARLGAYWIDKHEVTVAQYRRFCQATGHAMPREPTQGWHDTHPVVNVTWMETFDYAYWAGERLPSEAEWEKAARGTDGRIYPWGSKWDSAKCANTSNSTGERPVGSYPSDVSPYGALDMAGNAAEWCADWYDERSYQRYATGDLTPPRTGEFRVLRGGSWNYGNPGAFRSAFRYYGLIHVGSSGFRCVRGAG